MFSSTKLFEDRKWLINIIKVFALFEIILNDYNSIMNTFSIKSNNESQVLWKWNKNGLNNQTVSQTL